MCVKKREKWLVQGFGRKRDRSVLHPSKLKETKAQISINFVFDFYLNIIKQLQHFYIYIGVPEKVGHVIRDKTTFSKKYKVKDYFLYTNPWLPILFRWDPFDYGGFDDGLTRYN